MNFDWDSKLYLKFETERNKAIYDLLISLQRVCATLPSKILDIGCGPGNSTRFIAKLFPLATLIGIDKSQNMIAEAQKQTCNENITYQLCDANTDLCTFSQCFDVIVANASIHWINNQETLFRNIFKLLQQNGICAIQVPLDSQSKFHQILQNLVCHPLWQTYFPKSRVFYSLTSIEYWNILNLYSDAIEMWETTYYHVLPNVKAIIEWYSGSGLRPYLQALPKDKQNQFLDRLEQELNILYHTHCDACGHIIMQIPRLFFLAKKR